jgi:hypothetical protein
VGSGRFVGGFRGFCGPRTVPNHAFVGKDVLAAGGSDGWLEPILGVARGGGGCTPGTVLIDMLLATEVRVATDSVHTSPFGVYEIPVGTFSCNNLRIAVTADCQYVGGSTSIQVYLNDSGLPLSSRDFTSPPQHLNPRLANIPTNSDGAYHTAVFVCYPALAPAYTDFSGPIATPQSVYIWVPALFPFFSSATCNIKNVHIVITSI